MSLFAKLILLNLGFFVFICRASRICYRSLSISYVIIVVFSIRIFRNLDVIKEWTLRCTAMELESLRCIVSRLERVVEVRTTYALFSLETQSAAFLFLIFLSTESSSSYVNCPSLMSNWLLIIFVIGSCVTFGCFLCKFLKYFHRCIRSS